VLIEHVYNKPRLARPAPVDVAAVGAGTRCDLGHRLSVVTLAQQKGPPSSQQTFVEINVSGTSSHSLTFRYKL
jgi:hypothetical protein